jgi:hypothetical protein
MPETAPTSSAVSRVASLLLLFAPAGAMGLAAANTQSKPFAVGAGIMALIGLFFIRKHPVWRPPSGLSIAALFIVAACWLWTDPSTGSNPVVRMARGSLVVLGIGLFAMTELFRSGSEPRRRASVLCRRILNRPQWPMTVIDVRDLPEVLALRDALKEDMSPVVRLMADPRAEVRAAGFAALEGRPHWNLNEARLALSAAKGTVEPGVRAVAAYSLGGIPHAEIATEVSNFLRDPAAEVRSAAAAGLLADGGGRWPLVRDAMKAALSDPRLVNDGGLPGVAGMLPILAQCDLTAWATEGGLLADRSCRTLLEHYHFRLKSGDRIDLPSELGRQLFDPALGTDLRVGIARLLRRHNLLDRATLDRMTSTELPGPVRLMAAEILIADDRENADGLDVLRGLGRQQNREIALSIARILQIYLGMDMGLPHDVELALHSKQAGEVVRKVVSWASGKSPDKAEPPKSDRPANMPNGFPGLDAPIPTARERRRHTQVEDELDLTGGPAVGPMSIIR